MSGLDVVGIKGRVLRGKCGICRVEILPYEGAELGWFVAIGIGPIDVVINPLTIFVLLSVNASFDPQLMLEVTGQQVDRILGRFRFSRINDQNAQRRKPVFLENSMKGTEGFA